MSKTTKADIKVVVLMPIYNVAWCLARAMDSILQQSYADFELLIINDGSTDNSREIVLSYDDKRIRLVDLPQNIGLVGALNAGLSVIKDSTYIIRMDADEICERTRFEEQINFMEQHPEIGVSATWYRIIGGKIMTLATSHEAIRYQMLNRSPHPHSGAIMRKAVLDKYQVSYDPQYEYAEDLDLWMRLIRVTQFANIPKVLLHVTLNQGQLSKHLVQSAAHNISLRTDYIRYLFPELTDEESVFLSNCFNRILPRSLALCDFERMLDLCDQLLKKHPSPFLSEQLNAAVWFQLAHNAPHSIMWIARTKTYSWIQIPSWKYGWLLVKPLVKRFR